MDSGAVPSAFKYSGSEYATFYHVDSVRVSTTGGFSLVHNLWDLGFFMY